MNINFADRMSTLGTERHTAALGAGPPLARFLGPGKGVDDGNHGICELL